MMHKRDFLFLIASLLALFSLNNARSALASDELAASRKWNGGDGWVIAWNDVTKSCFANARYKDGTTLWIGMNRDTQDGFFAIANDNWKSVNKAGKYPISFRFDRGGLWNGQMTTRTHEENQILYASGIKSKFFEVFAKSSSIRIELKGTLLARLSLRGTRAALNSMIECTKAKHDKIATSSADDKLAEDEGTTSAGSKKVIKIPDTPETVWKDGLPFILPNVNEIRVHYKGSRGSIGSALVIANTDYKNVPELTGPKKDSEFVASEMRSRGIDVTQKSNLSPTEIVQAIQALSEAKEKDLLIFYYAGHAAHISGNDRIITRNFNFAGRVDETTLALNKVIEQIHKLGFKKVFIAFDACRNMLDGEIATANLNGSDVSASKRNVRSVSIGGVDLDTVSSADFTVSFSAGEGQVALDSTDSGISPYALAFGNGFKTAKSMVDFSLGLRSGVRNLTNGKQSPVVTLQWTEDYVLSSAVETDIVIKGDFHVDLEGLSTAIKVTTFRGKEILKLPSGEKFFCRKGDECKYTVVEFDSNPSCELKDREFDFHRTIDCTLRQASSKTLNNHSVITTRYQATPEYVGPEFVSMKTDFDQNGQIDEFIFKGVPGDITSFEATLNGNYQNYVANLSASIWKVSFKDVNSDGTRDFIADYEPSLLGYKGSEFVPEAQETCDLGECRPNSIIILDGKRLISARDDPAFMGVDKNVPNRSALEKELAQYFITSELTVGDLFDTTIYYDHPIFERRWNNDNSELEINRRRVVQFLPFDEGVIVRDRHGNQWKIPPIWFTASQRASLIKETIPSNLSQRPPIGRFGAHYE